MSISTGGGKPGRFGGFPGIVVDAVDPQFGSTGTASFGIIASPASNFAAAGVFVSSISWSWTASPSFGDAPGQQLYRIFPATITAPYPSPDTTVASGVNTVDTTGLTPNTTYQRMVTAFTAWGDSLPSNIFSTHTLASPPAPAAAPFSSMGDATLSFQWTSGTPANPDYTLYELQRSTDAGMAAAASSFGSSLSSAPAGLLPNTTYYFRSRAINLRNVPSEFTAVAGTATLASAPASPGLGSVFVTSLSFAWSAGANPSDTLFTVEISSDNFLSVTDSTRTLSRSATFFNLSPGTQYSLRAAAINRNSVLTAYTAVISTTPGILTNTAQPGEPGRPQSDRSFSSDGSVTFSWSEAQSPVGIFNYNFIVGSTPGGNDVLSSHTVTASSYTVYGLATGRSYYARVQARSNAGVLGPFSEISAGVPVFIPAQTAPVSKPINWPNPFNPAQGPTQIGLFLEEAATVMLRIFTLQGELVHEQSFALGPGNQIISWNGGNKSGVKVAPGGYIGRIEKRYGSRREVQKLKIAVLY
ncbi:MAG: fibronectin type III domain-containing protein [Elusimicrobia bacterium]|nr:fibronectin type III domain-containing protein [Elusimicrobiota bacterium]